MPVRTIPKNYRNVTGIAFSTKAVGAAQFESTLERDYLCLLEFSPEVTTFEVQPVRIQWTDNEGKARSYTPDVLVHFQPVLGRKPLLVEVKYRDDVGKSWSVLKPKLKQGVRFARAHGYRFSLVSEIEIRTPYLDNAKFLLPFRARSFSQEIINAVIAGITQPDETTPAQLVRSLSRDECQQAEYLAATWHLLASGRICTDMSSYLSMNSPIWGLE